MFDGYPTEKHTLSKLLALPTNIRKRLERLASENSSLLQQFIICGGTLVQSEIDTK
jgi:hypothetical protein